MDLAEASDDEMEVVCRLIRPLCSTYIGTMVTMPVVSHNIFLVCLLCVYICILLCNIEV